jgi:hypothetical protein
MTARDRVQHLVLLPVAIAIGFAGLPAQDPKAAPAYPDRDILTPFRDPQQIVAPPDAMFAALRTMRQIAESPAAVRAFDEDGREVVDDDAWRRARAEAERQGLDAGVLAGLMRNNRNPDQRDLAFYGAFYCANIDYVFNLISHIPGEPVRKTREKAYPRAIAFLRAHLASTFGSLSKEQQEQIVAQMPEPGSPAANAKGIKRLPQAGDTLFTLNLKPFFQLLDLDEAADQAQGLWFLKEAFAVRKDLAEQWLEPALPRVQQLLHSEHDEVREQAIGLLATIAAPDLDVPAADADARDLDDFAEQAGRAMFPPIRRVAEGLWLLLPGADRDRIVKAGREALDSGHAGETASAKSADGQRHFGFRIDRVPEDLAVLGIPNGAIVTAVNGVPVNDGKSLAAVIAAQFFVRERTDDQNLAMRPISRRTLIVELLVGGQTKVFEYRVL